MASKRRLPVSFYNRPTLDVAADVLGMVLVHRTPDGTAAGRIVEVEAYIGEDDPACHAAPGPTQRNRPLYGPPGVAYVYLNYGMHYLTNLVTEPKGSPAAILVRALEPIDGVPLMQRRRANGAGSIPVDRLCRGPGNLSKALGITLAQNMADLTGPALYLEDRGLQPAAVAWSTRIGLNVGTAQPWRAYVVGSRALSGPGALNGRTRRPVLSDCR
jgi:DNA-3-methyladenine glycosylase